MAEEVFLVEEDHSIIKSLFFLALLVMLAIVLGHWYMCKKLPWYLKWLYGC